VAIAYSVLLFLAGMTDNILKPLLLGRGVDAPMPVILLGALGGMATRGILGMFVGATLLALGYQIFMGWVANRSTGEGSAAQDDPLRRIDATEARGDPLQGWPCSTISSRCSSWR
jgi:predicted PurR-regulated permease PerM